MLTKSKFKDFFQKNVAILKKSNNPNQMVGIIAFFKVRANDDRNRVEGLLINNLNYLIIIQILHLIFVYH